MNCYRPLLAVWLLEVNRLSCYFFDDYAFLVLMENHIYNFHKHILVLCYYLNVKKE